MPTMLKSSTITKGHKMTNNILQPIHPGVILLEDYLEPMGISQYKLAKRIGVTTTRINEIVRGKRSISADTSLRLAKFFGISDNFWADMQTSYNLDVQKVRLKNRLEKEVTPVE